MSASIQISVCRETDIWSAPDFGPRWLTAVARCAQFCGTCVRPWSLAWDVLLVRRNEAGWAGLTLGGSQVKNLFKSFVNDESGQDLIEYALLAGFISLVAVVAITNVGEGENTVYGGIDTQVGNIPQ